MGYARRPILVAAFAAALSAGAAAIPATAADDPSPPRLAPTCAEGPERVGDSVLGTPCADRIVAPAAVSVVAGGAGDDTILAATSAVPTSCEAGCHLEVGSQTFEGGPGNDIVFGDRGNDTLRGNAGNDRLYGGVGDDVLEGGEGNDLLSGGFGADRIDGQGDDDYVRGDGTIDRISDTGGGLDTLSFSTGTTPGFGGGIATGAAGFPTGAEGERGVFLDLGAGGENANDGMAALGGGIDEVQPGAFERILGTPFSDLIVGGAAGEEIWGGGGADVLRGEGGADSLHGGADGDLLDGGEGADAADGEAGSDNCLSATASSCAGSAEGVQPRDTSKVSVGETTANTGLTQVYLVGSSGADGIAAAYGTEAVTFSLASGSFDTDPDDAAGCTVAATGATCPLASPLDSLLLAGMGGGDSIAANGFPDGAGVVATGGAGEDTVSGGASEDVLVDGPGSAKDVLSAGPGDDALLHNGGPDLLEASEGSDLFVNSSICDGETIVGGSFRSGERDNASWARLTGEGVDARLDQGRAGEIGASEEPQCPGGSFDTLSGIEDLEGSNQSDVLFGAEGPNQLFGHTGEDTYRARGGNDSIAANFGTPDRAIDCGPGTDQALIDVASIGDPLPIECERVREGREGEILESEPEAPPADRRPPRTRLLHHPPKLLRVALRHRRLVAFAFAANEPGSHFKCKLDRHPFAPCRSPRRYRVAIGNHIFRAFAVDAAGNRDRTPAAFSFRVAPRRPARPGSR
jgi:Ca2+-binding RTX toxin-like protein